MPGVEEDLRLGTLMRFRERPKSPLWKETCKIGTLWREKVRSRDHATT